MFTCDRCEQPGTTFYKFYGEVICSTCMDDAMAAAEESSKEG